MQYAVDYLKRYYPIDFKAWENALPVRGPPGFQPVHSIGVVNLFRFIGADEFLPTALIACCQLGLEIITGFPNEGGTQERLDEDDLGRCFVGKSVLLKAQVEAATTIFSSEVSASCYHSNCSGRFSRIFGAQPPLANSTSSRKMHLPSRGGSVSKPLH